MHSIDIDPELVAEGRGLLKQEGNLNWRWGDLVLRVMPPHSADRGALVAWAEEIGWLETGRTVTTLLTLRTVALAWPPEQRCPGASFTVHAELAAMANRFEVIDAGMTKRQARVVAGKKPEIASKEARGEVVANLLTDPAVLKQLAENPEFARAVRRASVDVSALQEADVDAARSDRAPGLHRADEAYSVFAHLDRARREAIVAVQRFSEIEALEGHRVEALRRARRAKEAMDLCLSYFEGQADRSSLDEALAALTEDLS